MAQFQVGKTYATRSACDHDCIFSFTILARTANLDAKDATSYVRLWNQIYMARLEPEDIATLKTMADIFRKSGTIEGVVPAGLFNAVPYEQTKR